jgi:hypothetical protein
VFGRGVELGHELAVGGPGGGEIFALFLELQAQVDGLLFQVGDLLVEGVDVGGRTESGFAPGLLAKGFGQAFLELADSAVEPGRAFPGGKQVGLQGCPGNARSGAVAGNGWGGFQRVELGEQVAVPVENVRSTPAARAMPDTLISAPSETALLRVAMTRWRRRAESAWRPLVIALVRGFADRAGWSFAAAGRVLMRGTPSAAKEVACGRRACRG